MSIRMMVLLGVFAFSGPSVSASTAAAVVFEPEVEQAEPTQTARAWLFLAAQRGDPAKIQGVIESGSDVNARDEDGMSALMFAAKHDAPAEALSVLIGAGAKINARDKAGNSALTYAVMYSKRAGQIDTLLKAGAGVGARNEGGETILMVAARAGASDEVIGRLLEAGAKIDVRDGQGRTALMHGIIGSADVAAIERLLDAGADVHARDDRAVTPLMHAARYSQSVEVIELLLKRGARMDDRVGVEHLPYILREQYGDTVLSFAAAINTNIEVVRFLIEQRGEKINEVVHVFGRSAEQEGQNTGMETTLLILAARSNPSPEVLEAFFDTGIDPKFKTKSRQTALSVAKRNRAIKGTDAFWKLNDASF